ncbi:diphthamide synthesis protein [Candidatus Pacearchaeota archaeon]|nr:diphthamide synthesis protein [Candidatus Pacearchaeota archaeon]
MAKVLFVEALRKNVDIPKDISSILSKLPKKLYLVYTIQYKRYAQKIKELMSKSSDFEIKGFTQILGCANLKTDADAILLIGSGRFHALEMALMSGKEVYILENDKLNKITKQEIDQYYKNRKTQLMKFYASDKIGIIVSLKPGQCNMKQALHFSEKLKEKGKQPYIFVENFIDIRELENFPIDSWINTACPGLELDNGMLNLRDMNEFIKEDNKQ